MYTHTHSHTWLQEKVQQGEAYAICFSRTRPCLESCIKITPVRFICFKWNWNRLALGHRSSSCTAGVQQRRVRPWNDHFHPENFPGPILLTPSHFPQWRCQLGAFRIWCFHLGIFWIGNDLRPSTVPATSVLWEQMDSGIQLPTPHHS